MSKRNLVIEELQQVPESMLGEILNFVRAVVARKNSGAFDTATASESSLAKDWLRPEEEEAWKDL